MKQIEENGAAYEDGRIQLGDRLIEASGISLEYVSFKQVFGKGSLFICHFIYIAMSSVIIY